jgi:ankyrin repeat protein
MSESGRIISQAAQLDSTQSGNAAGLLPSDCHTTGSSSRSSETTVTKGVSDGGGTLHPGSKQDIRPELSDDTYCGGNDCSSGVFLLSAVEDGQTALAKRMIERGADVNATDNHGRRPLQMAITGGLGTLAKLMVERGADVNATDNHGRRPLQMAITGGLGTLAKLMVERGADVNATDNHGRRPLQMAITGGLGTLAKLMVECGAISKATNYHRQFTEPPIQTADAESCNRTEALQTVQAYSSHGWSSISGTFPPNTSLEVSSHNGVLQIINTQHAARASQVSAGRGATQFFGDEDAFLSFVSARMEN